jgi:GNAT superfamily N-acetyltransferase
MDFRAELPHRIVMIHLPMVRWNAGKIEYMKLDTKPASDYPTPDLVKYLNLSFENYLVPIRFNDSQFLTMLRKDSVDLTSSRVLTVNGHPSGLALIARRGWTSRLAAMGIAREIRGKGLSASFMEKLIHEARQRGDREMVLEVIEQNEPAVRLYQRCRFQIVRRLIGMVRRDANEEAAGGLGEIDLRDVGGLISEYGLSDLPWQLSGETIAHMNPPARAYRKGQAYAAISNPNPEHVSIYSLLVEPNARGNNLGADMVRSVIANHTGKTWHVPALLPEELGRVFENAGFEREDLSQWQMRLIL